MNRRDFMMTAGATGFAATTGGFARGVSAANAADELPLDLQRPIIDPHHHLRNSPSIYLLPDILADIDGSGHNVMQTVFIECHLMYRTDGPAELQSLGETEYVRAIADKSASGAFGPRRIAAATIGNVDLRYGAQVPKLLEAHIAAANGRFSGVRNDSAYVEGTAPGNTTPDKKELLIEPAFREGFAALAPLGLLYEAWVYHPQLPQVTDLAGRFPDTRIVLNHCGTPLTAGPFAGHEKEVFAGWKAKMTDLARYPNVTVKLGGLGPFFDRSAPGGGDRAGSEKLAEQWRPWIETTIGLFGPERCLFESNYPANAGVSTYGAIWNAFKRITASYSESEKTALFRGTAQRLYGLES